VRKWTTTPGGGKGENPLGGSSRIREASRGSSSTVALGLLRCEHALEVLARLGWDHRKAVACETVWRYPATSPPHSHRCRRCCLPNEPSSVSSFTLPSPFHRTARSQPPASEHDTFTPARQVPDRVRTLDGASARVHLLDLSRSRASSPPYGYVLGGPPLGADVPPMMVPFVLTARAPAPLQAPTESPDSFPASRRPRSQPGCRRRPDRRR